METGDDEVFVNVENEVIRCERASFNYEEERVLVCEEDMLVVEQTEDTVKCKEEMFDCGETELITRCKDEFVCAESDESVVNCNKMFSCHLFQGLIRGKEVPDCQESERIFSCNDVFKREVTEGEKHCDSEELERLPGCENKLCNFDESEVVVKCEEEVLDYEGNEDDVSKCEEEWLKIKSSEIAVSPPVAAPNVQNEEASEGLKEETSEIDDAKGAVSQSVTNPNNRIIEAGLDSPENFTESLERAISHPVPDSKTEEEELQVKIEKEKLKEMVVGHPVSVRRKMTVKAQNEDGKLLERTVSDPKTDSRIRTLRSATAKKHDKKLKGISLPISNCRNKVGSKPTEQKLSEQANDHPTASPKYMATGSETLKDEEKLMEVVGSPVSDCRTVQEELEGKSRNRLPVSKSTNRKQKLLERTIKYPETNLGVKQGGLKGKKRKNNRLGRTVKNTKPARKNGKAVSKVTEENIELIERDVSHLRTNSPDDKDAMEPPVKKMSTGITVSHSVSRSRHEDEKKDGKTVQCQDSEKVISQPGAELYVPIGEEGSIRIKEEVELDEDANDEESNKANHLTSTCQQTASFTSPAQTPTPHITESHSQVQFPTSEADGQNCSSGDNDATSITSQIKTEIIPWEERCDMDDNINSVSKKIKTKKDFQMSTKKHNNKNSNITVFRAKKKILNKNNNENNNTVFRAKRKRLNESSKEGNNKSSNITVFRPKKKPQEKCSTKKSRTTSWDECTDKWSNEDNETKSDTSSRFTSESSGMSNHTISITSSHKSEDNTNSVTSVSEDKIKINLPTGSVTKNSISATASQSKKQYMCQCGKVFSQKFNLKQHIHMHFGVREFVCDECGKMFVTKGNLDQHKLTHSGFRGFTCKVCGKSFNRKAILANHLLIHSGEKKHECQICLKRFTQKTHLTRHALVHSGLRQFLCDPCGKPFKTKCDLMKHMLTHTGIKNFQCDVCLKWFSHKSNLKEHQVIHSGMKKFECQVCGKSFAQHSGRRKHVCRPRSPS